MEWFVLESLAALVIAVAIVVWTMRPRRRRPTDESDDDIASGTPR